MENAACYSRQGDAERIQGTDAPWIYTSGLRGHGKVVVNLALQPTLAIPAGDAAPTLDGKLDDPCWKTARAVPFENTAFTLLGANVELRVFKDAANLYFGYHRKPVSDAPSAADAAAQGRSDAFEIYITDKRRREGLHCGVKRNGDSFATFGNVDRYRKADPAWKGEWQSAVDSGPNEWTAEVVMPLKTLADSDLDLKSLQLNCMSQSLTASGREAIFLVDPVYGADFKRCIRFRNMADSPAQPPPKRSFTVRLHFAELADVKPGQRVFDVAIQGNPVLSRFDILKDAGKTHTALVKEFRGVAASDQIVLDLSPKSPPSSAEAEPVVSGLEILEEANP